MRSRIIGRYWAGELCVRGLSRIIDTGDRAAWRYFGLVLVLPIAVVMILVPKPQHPCVKASSCIDATNEEPLATLSVTVVGRGRRS